VLTDEAQDLPKRIGRKWERNLPFISSLFACHCCFFFLGWLLILKVVLSQPSKLFLCSVLLAGVLSCRSCVEQRPKLNPQIWCPNFGIRFQELFFLISKVPKEVVRI